MTREHEDFQDSERTTTQSAVVSVADFASNSDYRQAFQQMALSGNTSLLPGKFVLTDSSSDNSIALMTPGQGGRRNDSPAAPPAPGIEPGPLNPRPRPDAPPLPLPAPELPDAPPRPRPGPRVPDAPMPLPAPGDDRFPDRPLPQPRPDGVMLPRNVPGLLDRLPRSRWTDLQGHESRDWEGNLVRRFRDGHAVAVIGNPPNRVVVDNGTCVKEIQLDETGHIALAVERNKYTGAVRERPDCQGGVVDAYGAIHGVNGRVERRNGLISPNERAYVHGLINGFPERWAMMPQQRFPQPHCPQGFPQPFRPQGFPQPLFPNPYQAQHAAEQAIRQILPHPHNPGMNHRHYPTWPQHQQRQRGVRY